MKKLQQQIIEWAKAKGIDNPTNQRLKVLEEVGETAGAILRGNRDEILMELGDVIVTIIILHYLMGEDTEIPPLSEVYVPNKGNMIDNLAYPVFIADENTRCLKYVQYVTYYYNSTLEECLTMAWNKIKDRQGKTIDGTFIKD